MVLAISVAFGRGSIQGQATETPTPTPTATMTPMPTPDVIRVWLLPTTVNAEGTPEPLRWVGLIYQTDAGEVLIMTLLAALFFTLVAVSLIAVYQARRKVQ
jgi:hypothetical protein